MPGPKRFTPLLLAIALMALGALLGSAGVSFFGFDRVPEMIASGDPEARLGDAVASPEGTYVSLYAWRG